jgi:hypothetical protein
VDLSPAILEDDMTQAGGEVIRSIESGVSRNDSKRLGILLDDFPMATNANKTWGH